MKRGECNLRMDRRSEGAEDLRKACDLQPDDMKSLEHLANAYFHLGRIDDAISAMERVVSLEDGEMDLQAKALSVMLIARAFGYVAKEEYDWAVADLDRAVALDTQNVNGIRLRGVCHFHKDDLARALVDFENAVHRDPQNEQNQEHLRKCLEILKVSSSGSVSFQNMSCR